jgi:hypothetical protein
MLEDRELVGTPAHLSFMRTHRLLRPIARQARHQAFSDKPTSDYRGLRPARGLGLVLCRRDIHRTGPCHAAARSDTEVRGMIVKSLDNEFS